MLPIATQRNSAKLGTLALGLVLTLALGAEPAAALPDNRGWELVSPVDKNGGGVASPAEAGEGTSRAAGQGAAVAYASKASFSGGAGASPYSQYIARRSASGWVTENITPAHLAGAYDGSPYVAFSADLGKGLMINPMVCPAGDPCPPGYRVRDNNTGQIVAELDDPAEFEPSAPGVTFFLDAGHLYRSVGGTDTDLTPGGEVDALLGADASGATAYYRVAQGIWRWRQGSGSAQIVTAFGTGALADTSALTSGVTDDGNRLYFSTAAKLVTADVNLAPDVYQWQAQGTGSCAKAGGCLDLISAGLAGTSTFLGASANGTDVFFLTSRSLVWNDPGSVDLYTARVGGGFPEPVVPPLCVGDACQVVPPAPEDPVLTTVLAGPGNPGERYRSAPRNCGQHARRALRLSRTARALRRSARRSRAAAAAKRLRARAARSTKRGRAAAKAAQGCKRANRGSRR